MTKTALIVEDEIFVALDLERILTDAGYAVAAIAADTDSALQAAPGCGFAFVDVNLRDGMTGPQIAQRMVDEFGMKVVFVTANPAQIGTACPCATQSGGAALGYIRKPFTEQSIRAAAKLLADGDGSAGHADIISLPHC
jgi:CheY-like chemotaxis protein